jgi:hypothetical protein
VESCIHGMNPAWCSQCKALSQPKPVNRPKTYSGTTVRGVGVLTEVDLSSARYALVRTQGHRKAAEATFHVLNSSIKVVHIDGHPFVWAIELILQKAPSIETIQMIPSAYQKLTGTHRSLCDDRGIRLVAGYHKPEMQWAEGENRSPYYAAQQQFMKEMSGEQKALFDELLLMGFEFAQIAARYFCLNDESFMTQTSVAEMFGYSAQSFGLISEGITGVLRYLDPMFVTGDSAIAIAGRIQRKVERLRAQYGRLEQLEMVMARMAQELVALTGREDIKLPTSLPLYRFDRYKCILKASLDGSLEKFSLGSETNRKACHVVMFRYGLQDGKYHTLEEIGKTMQVTRERIRQLEEIVMEKLQIVDDE